MFTQAKLVLQSYKPLKLEKGMWFLAMHHGQMSVYELGFNIYSDEQAEMYVQLNGYPVEPYLYIEGNPNVPDETFIIATPEQIGWFDAGEDSDELYDITLKEINNILDNDGYCEIEVEYENLDDDEAQEEYVNISALLFENKVTIKYEEEEEYEEEDDDYDYCNHCNGSGEGMWDGSSCSFCDGSGVIQPNDRDDDDDDRKDWDDYHPHYNF